MKKAAIYILGISQFGDKPEAQKTIHYETEKSLITHLKSLQNGYCDEGERPIINKHINPATKRVIIECYSAADFRYVAYLGMQIKKEANKPIEIIN